jgi:hypothetical protein
MSAIQRQDRMRTKNAHDIRFNHQPVSCFRSCRTSNNDEECPLYAGLFLNKAACLIISVFLFIGVAGIIVRPCVIGNGEGLDLTLGVEFPLPISNDVGIVECCMPSSSGSTSSRSRSAALSACSARARSASSTTGCPPCDSRESTEFDNVFDAPAVLEPFDLGENE